ncbi:hypothetical protein LSH36_683g03087 [Paralvinella palmiformis]|uniref:Uncharacterized protein n=1 Tax=Paralvinella palmiformis TaxID=53620 RepID=A0AAD9MWA6_9ANNE|nr:hypothetical protein LSH36_683g03087 [Paralvinella palmiformis]
MGRTTSKGIHFVDHVARASCDLEEANNCLYKAKGGGCVTIIDSNFVTRETEYCRSVYVDDCTAFMLNQWNQALSSVIDSLRNECPQGCVDASQKLLNCKDNMYFGLKKLAADIVTNGVSSSDVKCTVALKRIYQCVVDAVAKCESLDYYALDTLKSEEMAFKQCNIVIKDLTLHNNSEEYNNKTIDSLPENSSLKTTLLAGIGVTSLVVIVAGGFIMYMWIQKIRESNYQKAGDGFGLANSFDSNTGQMGRSWRTRRFLRGSSEERTTDSDRTENEAQWSRWWTRPGFGAYGADIQNFGI